MEDTGAEDTGAEDTGRGEEVGVGGSVWMKGGWFSSVGVW